MEKTNELLEQFNNIDFIKEAELDNLDFYELCLYYDFLNNLEAKYDKTISEELKEG
jgi:hypothetical protein